MILMSDEVKSALLLRAGLINERLSEPIFMRMDQHLWKFFRWTTVLLLCRDAPLRWDTRYIFSEKDLFLAAEGCN
jgi:hypothetical protein